MLPIQTTEFYKQYLYRHFAFKQSYLMMLLKTPELREELIRGIDAATEKELETSLKIELHFSYLHLVETLFEFIFAIIDGSDEDLWQQLADSQGIKNYSRIDRIAEGDTSELDKLIECTLEGNDVEITQLQLIFYHGFQLEGTAYDWDKNLNTIRCALIEFAKEFKDRRAYNAYKHSFRLMKTIEKMIAGNFLEFDFTDSITFVPKGEKWKHVIQNHDHERDFRMAGLAYQFLENIILTRRAHYFDDAKIQFRRWDTVDLKTFSFRNIAAKSVTITMTPRFEKQ
jgi:hypothetical protein